MPVQTKTMLLGAVAAVMLLPVAAPAAIASPGAAQQQASPAVNGSAIEVLPARDLMNRPLRDPQGRDAGRIDGLILNTENGAVDFVIIAGGGNFNLNGNVIAVPWPVLEPPTAGRGPITIKISSEKLAQAPQLNPNMLGNLEQPQTRSGVYGYWGYPYWGYGRPYGGYAAGRVAPGYAYGPEGYAGAPGPATRGAAGTSAQSRGQQQAAQPQLTSNGLFVSANGAISTLQSTATSSANAMLSAPVFAAGYGGGGPGSYAGGGNGGPGGAGFGGPGAENGTVGNIREVMIDPRHGEVAFVLIERGGFLGLQPRWYAVPPEALAWAPYRGGYELTVSEQLLNTAPPVQPANNTAPNGPVSVPAGQLTQLYQHFGINPYWEQGTAGLNPGNQAGFAGVNSGSSRQPASLR